MIQGGHEFKAVCIHTALCWAAALWSLAQYQVALAQRTNDHLPIRDTTLQGAAVIIFICALPSVFSRSAKAAIDGAK